MAERRVLVVDDETVVRLLMRRILVKKGFTIDDACDGMDAIEKICRGDYGTILLDLMMPRKNGYDVIEYLRQENPALVPKVLIVTAADKFYKGNPAGVGGIITKPFDITDFATKVIDHYDRNN